MYLAYCSDDAKNCQYIHLIRLNMTHFSLLKFHTSNRYS